MAASAVPGKAEGLVMQVCDDCEVRKDDSKFERMPSGSLRKTCKACKSRTYRQYRGERTAAEQKRADRESTRLAARFAMLPRFR